MAKRKSIHIPGMEHGAPIPNGVVIGNMVFSSAIGGKDAKTGVLSDDPDEQAEAMFRNLRLFMETRRRLARQHRLHESLFERRKIPRQRQRPWEKMFPDAHDRPARHALKVDLRGKNLFQIEVTAVL